MELELKNFECCKNCEIRQTCKAPCDRFLDAKEIQGLNKAREYIQSEMETRKEAIKSQKNFAKLKKNLRNTLHQAIKVREGKKISQGKVIQITDELLVLRTSTRTKTVNFRDIFTNDIQILG